MSKNPKTKNPELIRSGVFKFRILFININLYHIPNHYAINTDTKSC